MILSKENLPAITAPSVSVPTGALFTLPEKVLQFGTGVLLRGLPDYFIDKANREGVFNGRVVVVKSTDSGDSSAFDKQDGLYTLCIRGIENGHQVEENVICSAISRVLSARQDWKSVLQCAHNREMQIIISNTTEVGLVLVNEDINLNPPTSFPGKLLAFLFERYNVFNGSTEAGMVIIPTELISNNGPKLKSILLELAHFNGLDSNFIEWLEQSNHFCSSLVDRIVPGKPDKLIKASLETELGYQDDLLTMSEVYCLWAIEGNDHVRKQLSFATVHPGVVIADDITIFKELKLRLLNATHTLSSGIAYLAGFTFVKEAMDDELMYNFIKELMQEEIALAIPYPVPEQEAKQFAAKVLDRFSNPSIEHPWINITLNYSTKIKMRVVEVLKRYAGLYDTIPQNIAIGFAAYLYFMKPVRKDGTTYYGELDGESYPINDDKAELFYRLWQEQSPAVLVNTVLNNSSLWDADLTAIPGFEESVLQKLEDITEHGMLTVIQQRKTKDKQGVI